jgi:hypothetical protein
VCDVVKYNDENIETNINHIIVGFSKLNSNNTVVDFKYPPYRIQTKSNLKSVNEITQKYHKQLSRLTKPVRNTQRYSH